MLPADELPFESLLAPFLHDARKALAGRLDDAISSAAYAALERRLLRRLSYVLAPPLGATFGLGRFVAREVIGDAQTPLYMAFETVMRNGGLTSVLAEYPVAARLSEAVVANWIDATGELLERLAVDRAAIAGALVNGNELGSVVEVIDMPCDHHAGGRSVVGLRFDSGAAVVYKPRDVRVELAVAELLSWMAGQGMEPCPRPLRMLSRPGYGWIEYAEAEPCCNEFAVRRFYVRAGALIAIAYALAATDLHMENVIAMGEHPVLVDLEMLMHPVARPLDMPFPEAGAVAAANRRLSDTVLSTGLLPTWTTGGPGRPVDVGGFGDSTAEGPSLASLQWLGIATDDLRLAIRPDRSRVGRNTPRVGGEMVPASRHVEAIIVGFRRAYELLAESRSDLLAPGGIVAAMGDLEIRCVFRTTGAYSTTLQRMLLSAECLRSEDAWEAAIESLVGDGCNSCLGAEERQALNVLDVPRFTVRADARAYPAYGRFAASGFELAVERITRLGVEDLERQTTIIRSVLGTTAKGVAARSSSLSVARATTGDDLPGEDAVAEWTLDLAAGIAAAAIRADDRTAVWIVHHQVGDGTRLGTSGFGLYAGGPGTALFLAALRHVTGVHTHDELVYEAIEPARRALRDDPELLMQGIGIGGLAGAASLAHALVLISGWMDDDTLVADAGVALHLVTVDRLRRDNRFDVVGGVAGAILALIAYYEHSGERWSLDRALIGGQRLLETAQILASGRRAWPAFSGQPHTGFAHGASGIALALARLWRHASQPELLAAVAGALEFERSLYRPGRQDWAVTGAAPTGSVEAFSRGSWCYGAPGILLARLGICDALELRAERAPAGLRDTVMADAQTALAAIPHSSEAAVDGLCCGTAGRVEALAAAGAVIDPKVAPRARRLAARMIRRVEEARRPATQAPPAFGLDAGLFAGVAGVGYSLLRLHWPELPSVLTLEPVASPDQPSRSTVTTAGRPSKGPRRSACWNRKPSTN